MTTALVQDKTILSGCAHCHARASPDSLILHRKHCFQHESSVARTCPFRSTVPVRSIPESRYNSVGTLYAPTERSAAQSPSLGYRRFPSVRTRRTAAFCVCHQGVYFLEKHGKLGILIFFFVPITYTKFSVG